MKVRVLRAEDEVAGMYSADVEVPKAAVDRARKVVKVSPIL
jgi:hypothetical protein